MPLILTPFRFPTFRLWIAASSVSVTGAWTQVLAGNWLLLVATGSATQMGLGVLAHAVPALLLGPWAGALADRLPARPLLTVTHLLHAAISVVLGTVASSGGTLVSLVYGAMVLSGVVKAFEGPAQGRFGSTMVDRSHLGAALAVGSLSNSTGRIVGMSAGGLLIAAIGPGPLFLINAATFLAVIAVLPRLRPVTPGAEAALDPSTARDTAEALGGGQAPPATAWGGLRYLLRDPMVMVTLGLAFLLGSLGRNYQVTMAAMSAGPLAGGPDGYGLLSTMFAAGAIVGGLLAGRAGRIRPRQLVLVGVAMSALQALSAFSPGLWSFAAVLLPIAAAAVVVDTVVAARLQLDQPLAVRGRVLALVGATGAVAGAVGAPLLGWLSDVLGPRGALGLAGLVTTVGCLAAAAGYATVHHRRHPARSGTGAPAPGPAPPEPGPAPAPAPAPAYR